MFLKASGYDILSTHNGYVMQKSPLKECIFKVHHTTAKTEDELNLIIDLGGTVVDVFVWHKVYGKIHADLNISSRNDVKNFIEGVRTGKSSELMNITGGYHYHTVRAETEEILNIIRDKLNEAGYIAPEKQQIKIDENDVIRVYDAGTNTFGVYNSNGKTITFFKPSHGQRYFDSQPGKLQ